MTEWAFEIGIAILLFRHVVELMLYRGEKKKWFNPVWTFECCNKEWHFNRLIWSFMLSWCVITYLSQAYLSMKSKELQCQKFLRLSVLCDNIVSFFAVFMMMFEKQLHESSQYGQVERATTRILKREQDRIDEIMEIVFGYPSKK